MELYDLHTIKFEMCGRKEGVTITRIITNDLSAREYEIVYRFMIGIVLDNPTWLCYMYIRSQIRYGEHRFKKVKFALVNIGILV